MPPINSALGMGCLVWIRTLEKLTDAFEKPESHVRETKNPKSQRAPLKVGCKRVKQLQPGVGQGESATKICNLANTQWIEKCCMPLFFVYG